MEKKIFKILILLSLVCLIFAVYSSASIAKELNVSIYTAIFRININFTLFFFCLFLACMFQRLFLLYFFIVIESILSFFLDGIWVGKWAIAGLFTRLGNYNKDFLVFSSGVAASCFIALCFIAIALGLFRFYRHIKSISN